LSGQVVDYLKHDTAKPVTQIQLDQVRRLKLESEGDLAKVISPIILTAEFLPNSNAELAKKLNSLEGMLLEIPAGLQFIAPSNPFGDYVVAFNEGDDPASLRTAEGGVLLNAKNPNRWYPGFRVYDYAHAEMLNVGAQLETAVRGPLHYRVDAWQLAVNFPFEVRPNKIIRRSTDLTPKQGCITVMTLNCFNLDPAIEAPRQVMNPNKDVDDDWGEGRFHSLASAIVNDAHCPDIVALQEIQDNDGAEQSLITDADETYRLLIKSVTQLGGPNYHWVDIDPELGADGGQPGGNIRNGYLYNPDRVELLPDSVQVLGRGAKAFIDSRKPLVAAFREVQGTQELVCVNVHLASKRHQKSIFAPENPGFDAKLPVRIEQAEIVADFAESVLAQGREFYITGDFNDTEHSATLRAQVGDFASNLVLLLPNHERYDYNHRGKLQVLMHGVVSRAMAAERAEYEIIHGNELIGVQPAENSDKPSDHAYVIARLRMD